MTDDYKKEAAIFDAAVQIEDPQERNAYLAKACAGDNQLRANIDELLKAHFAGDSLLDKSPSGAGVTLGEKPMLESPGTVIGRYKLLEKIGEGGFGVVYMAEQERPIRRRVALKIIKLGMDTRQVIARFEAERQALALMEHPNIARVLDAGATETGRPYFVMELVKGIPITEYCDKNNLDTRQRLELFIEVCKAVQHAHQKGIIHRDIKPSNVLITLNDDGTPLAKIIDFGIAKAMEKTLTEKTLFTEFKQFIGTPEYMSPEQAQMSARDVDTRSDIYSLGVLLYVLLTGKTPLESKRLLSGSYNEMLKIIREVEPPKPSACLNTYGDTLSDVAKHRQMNPAELHKAIRGDLDWVVMKTLEKDRTRRYETASELVLDIQRHLSNEPVVAGPPSATYRMQKFVRRNKTAVMFALSIAALLVIGFVVSTVLYFRAEQLRIEAERNTKIAKAVNDFLNNDLLASIEPEKAQGREVTVREVLDTASTKIDGKFEDDPLVEASIRYTLGNTYMGLGKFETAELHLERACDLHRDQLGPEEMVTLDSIEALATLYAHQRRYDQAESLQLKVLEIRRRVLGQEHRDTLRTMCLVANLYHMQSRRHKESMSLYIKTLEMQSRVLGEEHRDTLNTMGELANVYCKHGRFEEAELLLNKAMEIRRRIPGEDHPDMIDSKSRFADLYRRLGRYEESESLYTEVVEIQRRVFGEGHPETLNSMQNLSIIYGSQGRTKEVESLRIKMLEIARRELGEGHRQTLGYAHSLSLVYLKQGRIKEAESLRVKTLETARRVFGEEHKTTLGYKVFLANLYVSQGRIKEAESIFVKVLETQRRVLGEVHLDMLGPIRGLESIYAKQDRHKEVESLKLKALEIRRQELGEDHQETMNHTNHD